MNGYLQRIIRNVLVILTLVFLVGKMALGEETIVFPLIDRPGDSSYCQYAQVAFDGATSSIDLLLADARLDDNPLWESVLAAKNRGVQVRVLVDESDWAPTITERNRVTVNFLNDHDIEARFDDPAITTHAKLAVIDRKTVILGSSNWNKYSLREQEQTNLLVTNGDVGEVFSSYFDRLWMDKLPCHGVEFDLSSFPAEGSWIVPIPDTCDTANYLKILLRLLEQSEHSIHVVMYRASYYPDYQDGSSNEILHALISAASRGLEVKVLLDDCSFYPESAEANLQAALYLYLHGIEVRFDDPGTTTHAKLVIVDGNSVILGSTNWNYYSLEKNNEVDIAVINLPAVVAPYEQLFRLLWKDGRVIGD